MQSQRLSVRHGTARARYDRGQGSESDRKRGEKARGADYADNVVEMRMERR